MPTAQTTPLAFKVETWAIQNLRASGRIPVDFQIVHFGDETKQAVNRIVCKAKQGEREEAGPRPWNVTLEVRATLAKKSSATVEDYADAIGDSFENPTGTGAEVFKYLQILKVEDEDRESRKDTRSRAKTVSIWALET